MSVNLRMKFWCLQISKKANQPMKLGQKSVKYLVGFLGALKTPKFHSEINWPLAQNQPKFQILFYKKSSTQDIFKMTFKGSKMQISKACSLTRASERIKHDGSLLAKNVVKDPKSDEKCQKSPHHHIFYINVLLLMEFSTRIYSRVLCIIVKKI